MKYIRLFTVDGAIVYQSEDRSHYLVRSPALFANDIFSKDELPLMMAFLTGWSGNSLQKPEDLPQ